MKALLRISLLLPVFCFADGHGADFEWRDDGMYPGRYVSNAVELGALTPGDAVCDTVNTYDWCMHKFYPETMHYALTIDRITPVLITTYGSEVPSTLLRVKSMLTPVDTMEIPSWNEYDYPAFLQKADAWDYTLCRDSHAWYYNELPPGRYLLEVQGTYVQGSSANGPLVTSLFILTSDKEKRAPPFLIRGTASRPYQLEGSKSDVGLTLSEEYLALRRDYDCAVYYEFTVDSASVLVLDGSGRTRLAVISPDAAATDTLYVEAGTNRELTVGPGRRLIAAVDTAGMYAGAEISFRCDIKPLPEGHPLRYVTYDPEVAGHNYMITRTMLSADGSRYVDDVQHYDGLGRPSQHVAIGASPTGGNIVTSIGYNADGLPSRQYLPAVTDAMYAMAGAIDYQSIYPGETVPYSETVYEAASTGRPAVEYGPGRAWRRGENRTAHTYTVNDASVPDHCGFRYTVSDTPDMLPGTQLTLTCHGRWCDGALTVHEVTDEAGRRHIEFTDFRGRRLLDRTVTGDRTYADTYYVYDNYGNLTVVLTPEASDRMQHTGTWTASSDELVSWAYVYTYNRRRLMTSSRGPGLEKTDYTYDGTHRRVLVRDGNLRRQGRWRFDIADVYGRMCLTGTCSGDFPALLSGEVRAIRNDVGVYSGYDIEGLTMVDVQLLTVSYYDDYSFIGRYGCPGSAVLGLEAVEGYGSGFPSACGLATGSVTFEATSAGSDSTRCSWRAVYYDSSSRAIQSIATNHLGGCDREFTAYDFAGRPVRSMSRHTSALLGQPLEQIVEHTVDDFGRPVSDMHRLGDASEPMQLSVKSYDAVGRLCAETVGPYQHREYRRDVRSRLTAIESSYFSQRLTYTAGGDLSAMSWKAYGPSETERTYAYTYDSMARLTSAAYTDADGHGGVFDTFYSYDLNGNMLSLSRMGVYDHSVWSTRYGLIDDLTLEYGGGVLRRVTDSCTGPFYQGAFHYVDGADDAQEITYDSNGNIDADADRGIVSTLHDVNNRPSLISFADGSQIGYRYDAAGRRQSTARYVAALPTAVPEATGDSLRLASVTDYCGSIVYEDSIASRIELPGGYIQLSESGHSLTPPRYNFYLRDHQGNNRMVVDDLGTVRQINHFYPFGLPMGCGYRSSEQRRTFSDKEIDRTSGLDLFDFDARAYDPALGRFRSPDPYAFKYRDLASYAYCANSPLLHIDPSGKKFIFVTDCDETFIANFHRAWQILKDHDASEHLDYLNEIETEITIADSKNNGDRIRFDGETNTIYWSPYKAIISTDGLYTLSPLELLQHEADHAERYQKDYDGMKKDQARYAVGDKDFPYRNPEEKRVITGSERITAIKLGKLNSNDKNAKTRADHGGTVYTVPTVDSDEIEGVVCMPNSF